MTNQEGPRNPQLESREKPLSERLPGYGFVYTGQSKPENAQKWKITEDAIIVYEESGNEFRRDRGNLQKEDIYTYVLGPLHLAAFNEIGREDSWE